jgi:uncharacterized protein YkwD
MTDRRLFLALSLSALFLAATPGMARACNQPAGMAGLRDEVIAAINAERRAQGLSALRENRKLQEAAQGLACDNAARQNFSHVSADGTQLQGRLQRAGYRYTAANENVYMGSDSGARAVTWWMGSPGHRTNILTQGLRDIGVGVATAANGKTHWVVNMGATR